MNDSVESVGFVWTWVLGGIGVFFAAASRQFPRKGYQFLGFAMVFIGVAELLGTLGHRWGPGALGLVSSRASLALGLFAVSFNLHFLLNYCGAKGRRLVLWFSYVSVGAAALANLMGSWSQFANWGELNFPSEYSSPSSFLSFYAVGLVALHFIANIAVLYAAYKARKRHALGMLVALALLGAACLVDLSSALLFSERWPVAPIGTWLYALVMLAAMLSEVKGAAGQLAATTSTLAKRTAELEVSHAEIDSIYAELFQKEQLAAVGELAAAIAHEVRNPLAIIMNAVSTMRRPTLSDIDKETLLSIVNEESERLNELVAELLRFARPVSASKGPASLLEICQKASEEPPEGYSVKVLPPEGESLGMVLVDSGLFRLALGNLMANSAQAMTRGSMIELAVRKSKFTDGSPAVAVEVHDSGSGMTLEELEGARKPFFTTKPRGTGLGLPIALRIVEAHGGEVEITSTKNEGTSVIMKFPIDTDSNGQPSYFPGSKAPTARRRPRTIPPVFGEQLAEPQKSES